MRTGDSVLEGVCALIAAGSAHGPPGTTSPVRTARSRDERAVWGKSRAYAGPRDGPRLTSARFPYAPGTKPQVAGRLPTTFLHSCDKGRRSCRTSAGKMVETLQNPSWEQKLSNLFCTRATGLPSGRRTCAQNPSAGSVHGRRRCREGHRSAPTVRRPGPSARPSPQAVCKPLLLTFLLRRSASQKLAVFTRPQFSDSLPRERPGAPTDPPRSVPRAISGVSATPLANTKRRNLPKWRFTPTAKKPTSPPTRSYFSGRTSSFTSDPSPST